MRRGSKWDLIGREELKEKLDREDSLKLVMVLGHWGYRAKHMPGSLNIPATELAAGRAGPGVQDRGIAPATHVLPASARTTF